MGFLVKKSDFFLKNSGIHEQMNGFGVKLGGYPTISIMKMKCYKRIKDGDECDGIRL